MNHNFAIQQKDLSSSSSSTFDKQIPVICPKPRRVRQIVEDTKLYNMAYLRQKMDSSNSMGKADFLDAFFTEDTCNNMDQQLEEDNELLSSSPPFFYGSPPSRATNPMIHDVLFREDKSNTPPPQLILPSDSSSSPATTGSKTVGFFRTTTNFGQIPASVRIEGFNCLKITPTETESLRSPDQNSNVFHVLFFVAEHLIRPTITCRKVVEQHQSERGRLSCSMFCVYIVLHLFVSVGLVMFIEL